MCLSYANMVDSQPTLTPAQILESVDAAQKFGSGTLFFRQRELYKMGAYVNRYTKAGIYFAVGLSVLIRAILDNYNDLDGNLLEGLARLFSENVRLSVFPMPVAAMKELQELTTAAGWKWNEVNGQFDVRNIEPVEPLNHLYRYLLGRGFIIPNVLPGI